MGVDPSAVGPYLAIFSGFEVPLVGPVGSGRLSLGSRFWRCPHVGCPEFAASRRALQQCEEYVVGKVFGVSLQRIVWGCRACGFGLSCLGCLAFNAVRDLSVSKNRIVIVTDSTNVL